MRGSWNRTPRFKPAGWVGVNDRACSPIDPRLSNNAATFGEPSPTLSRPMPVDNRFCGVRIKLGVARPVLLSCLNNLLGVCFLLEDVRGVEDDSLRSGLKSLFGDPVRMRIFLEGGVLPG